MNRVAVSIVFVALATLAGCGDATTIASMPIADAGPDKVVAVGTDARLDGSSSSDSGGGTLTFQWTLESKPQGSTAALVAATTAQPVLRPDGPGTFLVSLVVSNGQRKSQPDFVGVRARGSVGNQPPIAAIQCRNQTCTQDECDGLTCWIRHGVTFNQLDGRFSTDPDLDDLTHTWSQVLPAACATECPDLPIADCPTIGDNVALLEESSTDNVWQYTAPATVGKLAFKLTVDDGELSDSACIAIDSVNFAPTATVAIANNRGDENVPLPLDGTGSFDSDPTDTSLSYAWTHDAGAGVTVTYDPSDAEEMWATVTGIGAPTNITFTLTVTDAAGAASTCPASGMPPCGTNCCGLRVSFAPACTDDSACASGNCECTNVDCSSRACSTATDPCICKYGIWGACTNLLPPGAEDIGDCHGGSTCNGSGVCG